MTAMTGIARAQRSGSSILAGRQKVKAAMASAMADEKLTRAEKFSILKTAQKSLTPDELLGLKWTLDRVPSADRRTMSALQAAFSPEQPVRTVGVTSKSVTSGDGQWVAVEKKVSESGRTERVSYSLPAEAVSPQGSFAPESPFVDEAPLPGTIEAELLHAEAMDDPTIVYEEYEGVSGGPVFVSAFSGGGLFGNSCGQQMAGLPEVRLSTSVDSFKGPMDLGNLNGNFGLRFAANGGFPLIPRLGIGVQAGTSGVLSNMHGTQFTGDTTRSQSFTTAGVFQRISLGARRLKYGFAFDWLYDKYYTPLRMSQWRVKLAWEASPFDELGLWASIPNDGETVLLDNGGGRFTAERFKPIAQGNLYHRHCWDNGATTTTWIGIAEEPGQFVFGADARLPLTARWAAISNFNYILPSASGVPGQDEEMWNLSFGIELTLGGGGCGGNHCVSGQNGPLFRLADNGSFAVRRY